MTINFGLKIGTGIDQLDFIKKTCSELPDDFKGPCKATLAPDNIFKADDDELHLRNTK